MREGRGKGAGGRPVGEGGGGLPQSADLGLHLKAGSGEEWERGAGEEGYGERILHEHPAHQDPSLTETGHLIFPPGQPRNLTCSGPGANGWKQEGGASLHIGTLGLHKTPSDGIRHSDREEEMELKRRREKVGIIEKE